MSMDGHGSGMLAEVRAEQVLTAAGMRILARNVRAPGSEIDLVAEEGSTLVFVEVKMRKNARHGAGREAVTPAKQRRICQGALYYMMRNGLMNRQARFDVVEIQGERVAHIRDAFPYRE